jgi:hypothetical protein
LNTVGNEFIGHRCFYVTLVKGRPSMPQRHQVIRHYSRKDNFRRQTLHAKRSYNRARLSDALAKECHILASPELSPSRFDWVGFVFHLCNPFA